MLLGLLLAGVIFVQAEACTHLPDDPAILQNKIEVPADDYDRFQANALRSTTEGFRESVAKIHSFVVTENRVLMVAVDKDGCVIGNSLVSLEAFISMIRMMGPNEI